MINISNLSPIVQPLSQPNAQPKNITQSSPQRNTTKANNNEYTIRTKPLNHARRIITKTLTYQTKKYYDIRTLMNKNITLYIDQTRHRNKKNEIDIIDNYISWEEIVQKMMRR